MAWQVAGVFGAPGACRGTLANRTYVLIPAACLPEDSQVKLDLRRLKTALF
jgi:hypothetical protein